MEPSTRPRRAASALASTVLAATLAAVTMSPAVADHTAATGQSPRERRYADRLSLRKHRIKKIRRTIVPGLVYTKIVDRRTPRRVFVLRADVAAFPTTFDVALASAGLPARATTSEIARANDAVAAINGDFSTRGVGRPVHPFVEDGTFLHTTQARGGAFAVSPNEERIIVERPEQTVTATNAQTRATWRIDRWNQGAPAVGELAGYSPPGGTLEQPPADACSIHLRPTGAVVFDEPTGLKRRYVVDDRVCASARMSAASGVVLSALPGTDEATTLMSIAAGTSMTIRWDTGVRRMLDVQGGAGIIVDDGSVNVPDGCQLGRCHADPRTGIGVLRDGRIIMVVVDGRRERYSIGLSSRAFARLMARLGAVRALMLDGGGSSTMWVDGEVVNRPSDGQQRRISNAALILPGRDPGE